MKKRMRRITALALAAMMTFSLAACGSNGKDADDAGKSKDGKTTIKITWWGGQSRHDYTQKLLDAYEESHPDIEFEALPAGWDGYFEKLSTQAASGSMPDIVQMDYLYISTYAKNDSVADLQPYIDDGTIDVSKIDENLLNSGKINDKMAGLVLSSSVLAVGYNPTVLEKAGVEAPTSDWTWEDYIELNQKAAETTGKESALIAAGVTGDTNVFNYWVRQHGGQLFNEDQTSLGYDDDSITADYFAMWKDMMDKNIAPDPDEFAQIKTLGDEASPVVKDEAATMIEWNNYTAKMSNVNDKLKLATPPLGDNADDKGLWIKPGMFFSVSENSKVKKECAEFIDWFINSEEANDIIMAERGTPVSSDIRQYMVDSGKLSPQQVDMFNYIDEAEKLSGTTPAPDPSGIAEVNEAFNNAGNTVFYGQATPEEAAKTFRADVEEILARNSQ